MSGFIPKLYQALKQIVRITLVEKGEAIKGFNRPQVLIWLLTSKCNLACSHCYAARFIGREELNRKQALQVVRDAHDSGVRHIGFTGGEVFLRKDALDLISYAAELGMSTSVVTNGSLFTEGVVRRLKDLGTLIFLSLDGSKKETHEKIRGKRAWGYVNSAAERMHKFGLKFSIIMAISNLNCDEVSLHVSLAKELGAKGACLIPVMPQGRANIEIVLKPEEMVGVIGEVEQTAEKLSFPVSLWCIPFTRLVAKSKWVSADFCRTFSKEIDLDPSGNVLLCDVLDIVLTNIRDKGILEAWREQENLPLVKSLTNPTLAEPCLDCPLADKCRGGCFARAQLMAGDIYAPDPLCPRVAKLT